MPMASPFACSPLRDRQRLRKIRQSPSYNHDSSPSIPPLPSAVRSYLVHACRPLRSSNGSLPVNRLRKSRLTSDAALKKSTKQSAAKTPQRRHNVTTLYIDECLGR